MHDEPSTPPISPQPLGAAPAPSIPARYPGADWRESPNRTAGRESVSAVVLHISQGTYAGGIDWLTKPASKASAHVIISPAGHVTQLVSLRDTAWTNGLRWINGLPHNARGVRVTPTWRLLRPGMDPNRHTISVELAGWTHEPRPVAQRDACVAFLRWVAQHAGLRYEVGATLIGHHHLDNVDRAFCPGPHVDLAWYAQAGNAAAPTTTAPMLQVIGVRPSIRLDTFLAVCRDHRAPFDPAHFDAIATRIYTLADWLDIDPAFFLALWLSEQGSPLGGSAVGQLSRGPLNIRRYGDRWPGVSAGGAEWNAYESWQLGCLHALMHLKQIYGARGLLHVETIVPTWAPITDGNDPTRYIASVRRDMAAMRTREGR